MDIAPSDPLPEELSLVAGSLARWPVAEGGAPVLINLSENHTFRVDGPNGARHVLRSAHAQRRFVKSRCVFGFGDWRRLCTGCLQRRDDRSGGSVG